MFFGYARVLGLLGAALGRFYPRSMILEVFWAVGSFQRRFLGMDVSNASEGLL